MTTQTTNKKLYVPDHNQAAYIGSWDVPVNTNFSGIDAALGGVTSIVVTGAVTSPVLMSASYDESTFPYLPQYTSVSGDGATPSYIPFNIILTGTLSANLVYRIPSGVCGQWSVYNNTSGSYSVGFQVGTGTAYTVEQGKRRLIVSDGTTVSLSNSPSDAQGTSGSLQFNNANTFSGSALRYTPSTGAFVLDPLTFTASSTTSLLTTDASQPLVAGMVIKTSAGVSVGTIVSQASSTTWYISSGTATASTTMYAYPATASADVAFTINSYDNQYGMQIIAGTTAGQSKGLRIKAGTNASDYSLRITDSATSPVDRFSIDGYGAVTIAAPSSSSTLPTLQISVASASTTPALKANGGAFTPPVAVTFNATSMSLNCALSNVFTTTVTNNLTGTLTFSNASEGQTINWLMTQGGAGSFTINWPSSVKFPNGIAPALSATGKTDLFVATLSGGYWYATIINGF